MHVLADGARGSADFVAYFFLRAHSLLALRGTLGLIATNTIAQGDTREVGIDRMVDAGFTITRAVQSREWPADSANLEYAAIWGSAAPIPQSVERVSDGKIVSRITTMLEPGGRAEGSPVQLAENRDTAFQGCIVLGLGFVLDPDEAAAWIDADARNAEVLFPYLGGKDLNGSAEGRGSRWVIDFGLREQSAAAKYRIPYARVVERVKPERASNKIAYRREQWWKFAAWAPRLRRAIENLPAVLVIAQTSRTRTPMLVPSNQVFDQKVVVIASNSYSDLAVLASDVHQLWALQHGSTMRTDPVYTPSDVFETFPRPSLADRLTSIGEVLGNERHAIMLRRNLGLTKLYNLVNDRSVTNDKDVNRLRHIHVELDNAVMAAYGWDDVALDHGFYTYRQMVRWTVSPAARVEILDRLLEENHRRAAHQSGEISIDNAEDTDDK